MSIQTNPTAASTAVITLSIDTYNSVESGQFTTINGITATGDARVTVNPAPPPYSVTVTPASGNSAPLDLEFVAQGPSLPNGTTSYVVTGVYFSGTGGSTVFTNQSGGTAGSVTVQDCLSTSGDWDFVVIVKQVFVATDGTRSSSIGVIDPPIQNEPGN